MTTQNTTPSSNITCPVCDKEPQVLHFSSSITDPCIEYNYGCNGPGCIQHFSITYREYMTGIHIVAFNVYDELHINLHHLKGIYISDTDHTYTLKIKPNEHMAELHKNLDIKGLCQYARDYHKMKAFL